MSRTLRGFVDLTQFIKTVRFCLSSGLRMGGCFCSSLGNPHHRRTQNPVADLKPGLYHAHMRIHAQKGILSETTLVFGKLAPSLTARVGGANRYGIVLKDLPADHLNDYASLIDHLGVGRAGQQAQRHAEMVVEVFQAVVV